MRGRTALGAVGVLTGAYGAFRLLELGWSNLVSTVVWLAGGVLLHDAVLAPVTIGICALGIAILPTRLRAPAAAGLLSLGTITVVAVPVLGRFGAREDNATLLDRNYLAGWLTVATLTMVGVAVGWVLRWRRDGRDDSGANRAATGADIAPTAAGP